MLLRKRRRGHIGESNINMECGIVVVTRYLEFEQLDTLGPSSIIVRCVRDIVSHYKVLKLFQKHLAKILGTKLICFFLMQIQFKL